MNSEIGVYRHLRRVIQDEITFLEELHEEIDSLFEKIKQVDEESLVFYTRAAGSILHDFYSGIEKIFHEIARRLDGGLPESERWHIELLESMAKSRKTRPPVISPDLKEELKEYLGFRHLFRSIYGSELKWEKIEALLTTLRDSVWKKFHKEIGLFDSFLEEIIEKETG